MGEVENRSSDIVNKGVTWIALLGGVALLLVAGSIFVSVLVRWIFNTAVLTIVDISGLNLAVAIAAFFPLGLVGRHIVTISLLGRILGARATGWLQVFGDLATFIVFALIAWQFVRFSLETTANRLATSVLQIPQAPWWWLVTAIFALCAPIQLIVLGTSLARAIDSRRSR